MTLPSDTPPHEAPTPVDPDAAPLRRTALRELALAASMPAALVLFLIVLLGLLVVVVPSATATGGCGGG